jgi:hypothetical protein
MTEKPRKYHRHRDVGKLAQDILWLADIDDDQFREALQAVQELRFPPPSPDQVRKRQAKAQNLITRGVLKLFKSKPAQMPANPQTVQVSTPITASLLEMFKPKPK